ncbi:MAG: NosD domain-containing protein [Candidatus Bathyarchaeia archaeon]|jgi:parallel beta-helix repeat protein
MKKSKKQFRCNHLFSTILVCLLIVAVGGQILGLAEANFFPISTPQPAFVIKSDGSVDPPTAPIHRNDNSYIFTDNIVGYTVAVERDDIVLDGNGYTLIGNGNSTGLFIKNRNGVTVKNMEISGFQYGIRLFAEDFMGANSTRNTLSDNLLTGNEYGIYMSYSSNNVLRNNHMNNNTYNFWIKGGYISDTASGYINDVDASNTVDDKPIIYWVNEQDKAVPSDAGYVALVNCANMTAQNLNLSNTSQGILAVSTTNSQVTQNHITNSGSGIYLFNSTNIVVTENTLANNSDGITGYISSNNRIASNNITNNNIGIYFTGTSVNNTISANSITANTVDGLNLWGSVNTTLSENTIAFNNETGINFFGSYNNQITANTIANNLGSGIKFWYHTSENIISENNITSNNIGILINDAYDNTITRNTIKDNSEWGMRFEDTQNNNVIYQNSFINNRPAGDGLQVSVTGVGFIDPKPGGGNVWDNGTTGNYWSDYVSRYPHATEIGESGTGNTPFVINENNIDRHPLMEPSIIPEFSFQVVGLIVLLSSALLIALCRRAGLSHHR